MDIIFENLDLGITSTYPDYVSGDLLIESKIETKLSLADALNSTLQIYLTSTLQLIFVFFFQVSHLFYTVMFWPLSHHFLFFICSPKKTLNNIHP